MDEAAVGFAADSAVLQALAEASEALIQACGVVRQKPCVASVFEMSQLRNLLSGSSFDFFVEVALQNTACMNWFITIGWSPDWIIESGIRLNRFSEQEWIDDLGSWVKSNSVEFIAQLSQAVHGVIASLNAFDFCSIEV